MATYTRIHRLLRLVILVQSGRHRTKDLAEICGTSVRNIYRDLKELEGAGVPIRFDDADDCYRLDPGFFLPPMQLTLEECLAMSVLSEQLGGQKQVPFLREALHAMRKIESQLPAALRDQLDAERRMLEVRTAPGEPADHHRDVYAKVQEAIRGRRAIEVSYESATGQDAGRSTSFLLEPYALFFSVRAWYAVGRRVDKDEVRSLKLSRFGAIRPTGRGYRIPKSFSLERHLGNAWRMIRGRPDHAVAIDFDPEFAPTVSDTIWHRTQHVEHRRDGGCTISFTVSGLEEIAWWVLSMGPHATVRSPKVLAELVRDLARRTADRYPVGGRRARGR